MTRIVLALLLILSGCGGSQIRDEAALRRAIAAGGVVYLPEGVIEIHKEIVAPEGIQSLEIAGESYGAVLRAAPDFRGRALISVKNGTKIHFRDLWINGSRSTLEQRTGLPPYDTPFHRFTVNNGILIENSREIHITNVRFFDFAGFPILIAASEKIKIHRADIRDSGSRNLAGRNNTTGGILLEEGTNGFLISDSNFYGIRGNAIWTHSLYTSPRNADGIITRNQFTQIARDAIQIGHATRVYVEDNTGEKIGYPESEVDIENKAIPVAIDTAGNVDQSRYTRNRFSDINGKCIDLDGFHHGEVTHNVCTNQKNFGIVMNNTNPDMQSDEILIADNTIDGSAYGGIFVIGSGNKILRNKLLNLNNSKCETCFYIKSEPDMLRSGIYLGLRAERPAPARNNVVDSNEISGHKMKTRCIAQAPGIPRSQNQVTNNVCRDASP